MNAPQYFARYPVLIVICLILLLPTAAWGFTISDIPNPRQTNGTWVEDTAGILSDRAEDILNRLISRMEFQNGTEMAIVTVPDTSPSASPKQFATELFNHWGIGKEGRDNGVLVLISSGDRRVEIETGYGIENILSDATVEGTIRTQIVPSFKTGNFDAGIIVGTEALIASLTSTLAEEPIFSGEIEFLSFILGGYFSLSTIIIVVGVIIAFASEAIGKSFSSTEGQSHNFKKCPKCQKIALVRFTGRVSNNKVLVIDRCQNCSYEKQWEETTQEKPESARTFPNFSFHVPSNKPWDFGGSWDDGGDSGFGGGSSDGGGAGDDW